MHTQPTKLDLSGLPKALAENWNILLTLRADAQVEYALQFVAGLIQNSEESVAAYDAATRRWEDSNKMDAIWVSGNWPVDAANNLGNDALAEARRIVAETKKS